jgi:uncharacterized membrane protein
MKSTNFTESLQKKMFSPWVAMPAVYLLFLFLAASAYLIPSTARFLLAPRGFFPAPPQLGSYLVTLLGVLVLTYASMLGRRVRIREKSLLLAGIFILAALTLKLAFQVNLALLLIAALGYAALLWYVSRRLADVALVTLVAIALAVLFSLSILIEGIPLLEAEARVSTAMAPARALFHGFATFAAAMLVAYQSRKYALPGVTFLAALGVLAGFKSDATAVLLSAVIAGLMTRRITVKEAALGVLGVLLLLTLLSNYIARAAYGTWQLPPSLYPFYRAGFTLGVFSEIVKLSMPYGYLKGAALLSVSQEIVSTEVLGYAEPRIITSTLLGPGMLDFGLLGLGLTAFLLGSYLGAMYNAAKTRLQLALYAIALTHAFILVEVGLQLTSIIYLLSLLYLFASGERR